ncbi:DciA family protein [Streptomyces griseofuscus]|uniref:DciA family protein n=1 Tax=Streptomyces griseofuscus TaxID=146922 RepID=UPI003797253D
MERPDWFGQADDWWRAAAGADVARYAQPVGVSSDGRLCVLCSDTAWSVNLRLLAPHIASRLNDQRPPAVPEVSRIAVLKSSPPEVLIQRWAELVGTDLAEQVRPHSLADWGQELVTEADTAQARDLLAQRAPVVLARLRSALPETSIIRLRESSLRPVWVLVATSPDFSDRQYLESVLMDVWHDATQTAGPEHPLCLLHAGETAADQMIEEWATSVRATDLPAPPGVDTFTYLGTVPQGDAEAQRQRNEWLVGTKRGLCVAFVVREDEQLPLAELARERGATVFRACMR